MQNPGIFDKCVKEVAEFTHIKFVISRLWRNNKVSIPTSEMLVKENDRLLVVTTEKDAPSLTALFGKMEEEIAQARQDHAHLLCEVPLLFECGTEKYFDKTAVVWCSRELRHERLCRFRNFTPEEIAGREARQWSAEKKLEAADVAFINNGGAEFLYRQIDGFIKEFHI